MKNKILIGIALIMIGIVIYVRWEFSLEFDEFKQSVARNEMQQLENFRRLKEKRISKLAVTNMQICQLFKDQFDESIAILENDTSFSYLYLEDRVKYKRPLYKYIDCLNNKCVIDIQNEINTKLNKGKEVELANRFGDTYEFWYTKIKREKPTKSSEISEQCGNFFPGYIEVLFEPEYWRDFEKFLIAYNLEMRESLLQNKQTEIQYEKNVAVIRSQLRKGIDNFDRKLSERKSQILPIQNSTKNFYNSNLGMITYEVSKVNFDKQVLQSIADEAFTDQWKNNSLMTGETPYSYCYGSSNDCDSYGCSKISVRTGNSDVLVTVKDGNREVVRHAYIQGGHSFTFNLPDGQYQVFFYSGNGWNPNKMIKGSACGTLRGGFVSGEDVSKDKYISLNNQIMSYELILQQNGNLSTSQSSMSEAF